MKMTFNRTALLLLLTLGTACASASSGASTEGRSQPHVLTAEQIHDAPGSNAYEVIRTIRPRWLQKRGVQSINAEGDIVVYYDNTRMGGPEALRSIPSMGIVRMEFLDASSATQRWGTGHTHGAILVVSRS